MKEILAKIKKFRDDRDWMKFHDPRNMAISISLEAAELLEHFQWKSEKEIAEHVVTHKDELAKEIADIAVYVIELADNLGIDLKDAISRKMDENARKYPIEKARGIATKYDKL